MQEQLGASPMPDFYPKTVDNDQDNGTRGNSSLLLQISRKIVDANRGWSAGASHATSIATQACARPENKGRRRPLDTRAEKIKCKVEEEIQGLEERSNAECEWWVRSCIDLEAGRDHTWRCV